MLDTPSSSSDTQKVVQQSSPWKEQIPYLTSGFAAAKNLFNSPGPGYYPGQTVASVAPETTLGWNAQAARAAAGSPNVDAAKGYNRDVLNGNYLRAGNPYLGAVDDAIWHKVQPATASLFSGAGRYGQNAAFGNAVGGAYTDAIAPGHFADYEAERGRMDAAGAAAPALGATDYADAAAMTDVGKQRQAQAQAEIGGAMDRYAYTAGQPANKLAQYLGLIQGNYGGTSTSTQPVYSPGVGQQILGYGSTALGAAGALKSLFGTG